jgi:hypothetical protein
MQFDKVAIGNEMVRTNVMAFGPLWPLGSDHRKDLNVKQLGRGLQLKTALIGRFGTRNRRFTNSDPYK